MQDSTPADSTRTRLGAWDRFLVRLASWALRLVGLTLRWRWENLDRVRALLASGRPVVVAGLHGHILLGILPGRSLRPAVMISQSRDGERIAQLVEALGWRAIRGSSSRGGARGLARMIREVRSGALGVHMVDGPRGPAGRIKPGLLLLAQRTGAVIVPTVAVARPRWQAGSWDRMQVPLPFARVVLRSLDPVEVPADLDPRASGALIAAMEKRFEVEFDRLEREMRG